MIKRLAQNLFAGWFRLNQWFPRDSMQRIRDAISLSERSHSGEICFAVESRYSFFSVLNGLSSDARARELFSSLRVWDTEQNTGVLLYLQLAERRCLLIADRGIYAKVPEAQWQNIVRHLTERLHAGENPEQSVTRCIEEISMLLIQHFPANEDNPREISDEPIIL
jgi:hypothetical protein